MKDLILLHGAIGAKSQFDELGSLLKDSFKVHALEFEGHGSLAGSGPFRIDLFAAQLEAFIAEKGLDKPLIFGYSMGGYVALYLAAHRKVSLDKLVTLGTKFDWNPTSAVIESKQLNPAKIEEKVPAFASYLKTLHGEENWKMVLEETAEMMLEMGKNPPLSPAQLEDITFPVICMRGGEDIMVSKEETLPFVTAMKNAEYVEIPEWKHPIDRVPMQQLAEQLHLLFSELN